MTILERLPRGGPQPQRLYKWKADFAAGGPSIDIQSNLIESVGLPLPNNQAEAFHTNGTNLYFPNFVDIAITTIDFYEIEDGRVLKQITKWRNLVQDKNGFFGYPASFKKNLSCQLLTSDNKIHTSMKLVGIWPTTTSPPRLSYTEGNKLIISQDFSVDGFEIE